MKNLLIWGEAPRGTCNKYRACWVFARLIKMAVRQKPLYKYRYAYEPPHDKTNKMTVRPAKTRISLGICLSSCGQQRFWLDWADAQADLSLCWVHMPFCWFCHEAAHILNESHNPAAWYEALPGVLGNRGTRAFISGDKGLKLGEQGNKGNLGNRKHRKSRFSFWGTEE